MWIEVRYSYVGHLKFLTRERNFSRSYCTICLIHYVLRSFQYACIHSASVAYDTVHLSNRAETSIIRYSNFMYKSGNVRDFTRENVTQRVPAANRQLHPGCTEQMENRKKTRRPPNKTRATTNAAPTNDVRDKKNANSIAPAAHCCGENLLPTTRTFSIFVELQQARQRSRVPDHSISYQLS